MGGGEDEVKRIADLERRSRGETDGSISATDALIGSSKRSSDFVERTRNCNRRPSAKQRRSPEENRSAIRNNVGERQESVTANEQAVLCRGGLIGLWKCQRLCFVLTARSRRS